MKKLVATVVAGLLAVGAVGCLAGCGSENEAAIPPKYTVEEKMLVNLDKNNEFLKYNVEDLENFSAIIIWLTYEESHVCNCGMTGENRVIEHRAELEEHYTKVNAEIIESLNFTDAENVEFSHYGPFISYSYSSFEVFMGGDYAKLCRNNSDSLKSVSISYAIPVSYFSE